MANENINAEEGLNSLESESGVIATLIHHPDFVFCFDQLEPKHFSNTDNQFIYSAIRGLAYKGVKTIDAYNLVEYMAANSATVEYAKNIKLERLNELIEMSDTLSRGSEEEYKILVSNVLEASFRRETYSKLKECEGICLNKSKKDFEKLIYRNIDDVMNEYSSTSGEVPQFKDVVDTCWAEIESRQGDGYTGIPFKFPTLNEFATIEPSELFLFAASAKQGKSIMLLNCAVDLLRRGKSVLYIDSELNTRLFTARLLAHLTGVEYRRVTSGNYSGEEKQKIENAITWLKTRKFTHLYLPIFDQQTVYTTVQKVRHSQGIDVLIIDYFKSSGDGDAFDTYQELGRFVD